MPLAFVSPRIISDIVDGVAPLELTVIARRRPGSHQALNA